MQQLDYAHIAHELGKLNGGNEALCAMDDLFGDIRLFLDLANEIIKNQDVPPRVRGGIATRLENFPHHIVSAVSMRPGSVAPTETLQSLRSVLNFVFLVGAFAGLSSGQELQRLVQKLGQNKRAARATEEKRKASQAIDEHVARLADSLLAKKKHTDYHIAVKIHPRLKEALENDGKPPLGIDATRKRVKRRRTIVCSSN